MTEYQNIPGIEKLWRILASQDPSEVETRTLAKYDNKGIFTLVFLNQKYNVDIKNKEIKGVHERIFDIDAEFRLLILYYLVFSKNIPIKDKWISVKNLPTGNLFFTGPHKLPENPILKKYGNDLDGFLDKGMKMGGKTVDYGDAAINFITLPRIPLICIIYAEDEEFPAKVNYLFDESIKKHFPLDIILSLVNKTVKIIIQ